MGTGAFSSEQEATSYVKNDRTYEPDEKMHARYNEKYCIYNELYDTIKEINHKQRSW
jgi:sugar (pentulose or hexulose) kinase